MKKLFLSVPVDMQQALLARIAEKEGNEEKVYRSIEASSDLKKKNIERGIFGGSFFDTMQSSFMPTSEPSLDDNYILDSSDVLRIQLIGQKDSIDSYQKTRDGSINLPDIGKLYLSGLSLNQASKIIAAKVNQTYIGVEAYVSLKNIRDVNVLVSGNAYNPGVYTLNGNSNILHALHAAGGIDSYGSYRSIKLIRNDKVIETLDIYKILIDGKVNIDTRLRTGDIIFVEPRANVVLLEGAFKRSMQFELLDNQNLSDAIYYANGVRRNGDMIDIDAKKGTINVRLTKAQLASRKRKWKARKSDFGSGTLWKYAQTVGPAYLGAPTHPGKKKEVKDYSKI